MTIAWALIAAACLAVELMTGTFYLLVLCVAAGTASALAAMDVDIALQMGAAAAVGLVGILIVQRLRGELESTTEAPALSHPEAVIVEADGGRYRVRWRGTEWPAEGPSGFAPDTRVAITGQSGNTLHVASR